LTEKQKESNRALAQIRIRVEHALCGVKCSRCVKDTLRNTQDSYSDRFMENATGLHNLRVEYRKRPLRR
jgi:DDE superfamily endonuclease